MCSQDNHVLKNGFEEEKSFVGDTIVWVFLFSRKRNGDIKTTLS
jgi:hypothetical protein